MGKRKEKFIEQGIIGLAIVAAIIYAVITILFWLLVVASSALLIYFAYLLTTDVEWFEDRIWASVVVYFVVASTIFFGWSEILADYGKIDKSFRETAIEWAQDVKVYKSNKGNFKVTPDYENIAEKIVPSSNTQNTGSQNLSWNAVNSILNQISNPQK